MYHILAIDDDSKLLKILEAQIKKLGMKVVSSSSGREGIEAARIGNPDMILLDILMPEMDGFEVLKELRRYENTKDIPVIMFTSRSDQEDVKQSMQLGAVDYVIKPYKFEVLQNKIQTALKYGKLLREKRADNRIRHIIVDRASKRCLISFKTKLNDKRVLEEIKNTFNKTFLSMTVKDYIIMDFSSLSHFDDEEIKILNTIVGMFQNKVLNIVCGRHYGNLVSRANLDEKSKLFITFGDLEAYLAELLDEN